MELLQILIFAAALSVEKQPLRRVDQMDKIDRIDSKKVFLLSPAHICPYLKQRNVKKSEKK
jgi:hypothetical protein